METLDFEQGPIRPPNEARSLLIRITRNCSWNQCLFCPVYKGTKFSRRSVREIKEDIRTITRIIDELKALSWRLGSQGQVDDAVITEVFHRPHYSHAFRNVAAWLYYQEYTVFLQDANNLVLPAEELVEIVTFLRQEIPQVTRITSYTSDHIMNLLEDISGALPQDKAKMLAGLDAYLHLSEEERLIYRFGRHGGAYRSVRDMKDLVLKRKIEKAIEEVRAAHPADGGIESFLNELVNQTI